MKTLRTCQNKSLHSGAFNFLIWTTVCRPPERHLGFPFNVLVPSRYFCEDSPHMSLQNGLLNFLIWTTVRQRGVWNSNITSWCPPVTFICIPFCTCRNATHLDMVTGLPDYCTRLAKSSRSQACFLMRSDLPQSSWPHLRVGLPTHCSPIPLPLFLYSLLVGVTPSPPAQIPLPYCSL